MTKPKIGDEVIFKPTCPETYSWEIPEFGQRGKIKKITYNKGIYESLGVMMPVCFIDFEDILNCPIYAEDLFLAKRNKEKEEKDEKFYTIN